MSARADVAAGPLLPPQMTKGACSGALQTSPIDTLCVRPCVIPGRMARVFTQSVHVMICAPVVPWTEHVSQDGVELGFTRSPIKCNESPRPDTPPPVN